MHEIDNGDGTRTLVLGDRVETVCGTSCLVCGEFIPCSMFEFGIKICDECKQAVLWAKEKMKDEHNE